MEARTILLFISAILIVGTEGTDSVTNGEQRHKRSDGIVCDSLHQMVVDYLDGLDILKKFKEIKTQLEEIKKFNIDARKSVAFSAHLNVIISTSSALIFKRVITNIGGGYNKNNGNFNCPIAGLYLFSVTLESYNHGSVRGYLMKNKVSQAMIYSALKGTGHYQSATVTLVLQLKVGDKVWVKGAGIQYSHPSYFTGLYVKP